MTESCSKPKGCGELFEQEGDVGETKCAERTLCPECSKKSEDKQ